jgi:hypothetical protein
MTQNRNIKKLLLLIVILYIITLEHDPKPAPSARYTPEESNHQHITIKREESGLDQMLKAGQILSIFQALKPIR